MDLTMLGPISHIALVVRDPTRTAEFLQQLFGAKVVRRSDADGHDETYVRLGTTWFVLPMADVGRPLLGDHVAFQVSSEQLGAYAGRLEQMGHAFQMARSDTALYFTDFDNHVFELDSTSLELDAVAEIR
ncbi:VOC family protein [Lysobacter tyrosinilyticus]